VLGKALNALLDVTAYLVGSFTLRVATVIDQIAYLLHRAAMLSKEIMEKLEYWISLVLKYAGRAVIQVIR
jgi:uncharacterized protein YutE (UPF0331/DUF86 family)